MKKTVICTLLTLCLILAFAPTYASAVTVDNPFTDVKPNTGYHDAVLWAYNTGVTSGTTSTSFSPDDTCTRGQVVTFLWRAMGEPEPTSASNSFSDVKSTDYFYKAVLWAVENGITNGTTATTFTPNNTCTYGQVITFLWRTNGKPEAAGISEFSETYAGKFYCDPVVWADSTGLLKWPSVGFFEAEENCPRSRIVTYLYKNAGSPQYDAVPKPYQNDIPAAQLGFDSESAYSDMTYSDGWIYYCDNSELSIYQGSSMGGWLTRIRPDGTGKQVLVKDCVNHPQASGGYIYFSRWSSDDGFDRHDAGQLWRIKPDGTGLSRVLFFGNDDQYDGFVVYGDYIFFETSTGSPPNSVYGIWRQKIDGTGRKLIIDDTCVNRFTIMDGRIVGTFSNGGLGRQYSKLYGWPSDEFNVCSLNLDGSDVRRYETHCSSIFRAYNGRIYWVDSTSCPDLVGLYVRDADGSNVTRLTSTTSVSYMPHGDYVYYVDYDSENNTRYYTFNRIKVDGTGSEELLVLTDPTPGLFETFTDMWYYDGAIIYGSTAFREGANGWEWVKRTVENAPVYGPNAAKCQTAKGRGPFDAKLSTDFTIQYDTPYHVGSLNPVDSKPGEGTRIESGAWAPFVFERDGSYVNIRLDGSKLYVGIRAGVQEKGNDLILWSKTGSDSQRFELVPVSNREYKLKTTQGLYITNGEIPIEGEVFLQDAYVLTKSAEMAAVFTLSVK